MYVCVHVFLCMHTYVYFPKKDYITYIFLKLAIFTCQVTTHIFHTLFSPRCLILCYTYVISTVEIIIGFVTNFNVTNISILVCVYVHMCVYLYIYIYICLYI